MTQYVSHAVATLARELRLHHQATAEHSNRLASLARRTADLLELDVLEAIEAELVAILHDVGKLTVDVTILDRAAPLEADQLALLRRHTIAGEELLVRTAGLEHLGPLVRATHERWDGQGYPDGLAGTEIPLVARIVAAADAWDAMVSRRAYAGPFPRAEARRRLLAESGRQFDPVVVEALLEAVRDQNNPS